MVGVGVEGEAARMGLCCGALYGSVLRLYWWGVVGGVEGVAAGVGLWHRAQTTGYRMPRQGPLSQ